MCREDDSTYPNTKAVLFKPICPSLTPPSPNGLPLAHGAFGAADFGAFGADWFKVKQQNPSPGLRK